MFNLLPILLLLTPIVLSDQTPLESELTHSPASSISVSLNPRAISVLFRRQGCATGKVACGTGCIPNTSTNTCCGSYYCDSGRTCDTDGSCTCLGSEKKCGTGCIPTGASCCPLDLKYCDAGKYCSPVKGYCCNNGEDTAACASRQGFVLPTSTQGSASKTTAASGVTAVVSITTTTTAKSSLILVSTGSLVSPKVTSTPTNALLTSTGTASTSSDSFFSKASHIGAVVAGGLVLIAIILAVAVCGCIRRRRRATIVPAPPVANAFVGGYQAQGNLPEKPIQQQNPPYQPYAPPPAQSPAPGYNTGYPVSPISPQQIHATPHGPQQPMYSPPQGSSQPAYGSPQGPPQSMYSPPQGPPQPMYTPPQGSLQPMHSPPQGSPQQMYSPPQGSPQPVYSPPQVTPQQTYSAPQGPQEMYVPPQGPPPQKSVPQPGAPTGPHTGPHVPIQYPSGISEMDGSGVNR